MTPSKTTAPPPLHKRIGSVWFRHMRVYTRHIVPNGLPPFLEPLIFLAGIGLGLSGEIGLINDTEYIQFLGVGLLITSAMYTSAFECSFGTFIRMKFDKIYDGMLATPISVSNLIAGEMLWAASKGFFFSACVLIITVLFGVVPLHSGLLTPLFTPIVGFITGLMFSSLSLLVTSFVKTINHFNFYFTGFLSPMFFFSGVVFPITNLPPALQTAAEFFPLTHSVRMVRVLCGEPATSMLALSIVYSIVFIIVIGSLAVRRLGKRLIL